jgi:N-acetylneuraminate synthase
MTLDLREREFFISDPASLWQGHSLYELYQKASTPWEWHGPIFERCRQLGMIGFSTPFDASAVDFLESLDVPCYKIASFENADLPLIAKAAATGKPLIISTGMATLAQLDEAVQTARAAGCDDLMLLKCTSSYPASPGNSNLLTIPHLRQMFDCQVGLSDHTLGIGAAIAAVALGAVAIEKHVTLKRADGGVDADFSLEPPELQALVQESERAWQALGNVAYGVTEEERGSLVFRRSLYVIRDLRAGETLTRDNVRALRPGLGLAPKYYDALLGKRVRRDVPRGTAVTWDLIG